MPARPSPLFLTTALVLFLGLSTASRANTIHVNVAGGGDYASLKEGVMAAGAGDTVLVAAGIYTGPNNRGLDFAGVNLVLLSEAGAAVTIIDGQNEGMVIYLHTNEDTTTVIQGFTITHGAGGNGAGIAVEFAACRIADCIFKENVARSNGGGLYVGYATSPVTVSGCAFVNNTAKYRAGGMMADGSTVTVTGCVFRGNSINNQESGAYYGGGGFHGNSATALLTGCTFAGNSALLGPGGIKGWFSTITLEKSVVAFSTQGAGIEGATAANCVIFGNAGGDDLGAAGTNVLYVDPLFCDAANGDLALCANSPCLPGAPANPAAGQLIGALGQGCASCAAPVTGTTWGAIKALYR
jgi:hypothetical protein